MDFLEMAIAQKLGGGGGPSPSGTKQISITENGTTTEDVTAYASAEITVDVPTGGGTEAPENDVIFYDYDGTRLYSYTASQFANLTAMPANPDRTADGLTAQGWNWSLADAKAYVADHGMLDIGQMYITTSGATEIDIELIEGRTSPYLEVCPKGTVEIDWGDGTVPDTVTGNNLTSGINTQHIYAKGGKYTISVKALDGEYGIPNSSNSITRLLNANVTSAQTYAYALAINAIRIGANVSFNNSCFDNCYNLKTITFPNNVKGFSYVTFANCYTLKALIIPNAETITMRMAQYCYNLEAVSLPASVTRIANNAFYYCVSLKRCCIPNNAITGGAIFQNCYSLMRLSIGAAVNAIESSFLYYAYRITRLDIPIGVARVQGSSFYNCSSMKEYHFKSPSPPLLAAVNAFGGIPSDCIIYVPAESLEAYKTETNWSNYASQIQAEPT